MTFYCMLFLFLFSYNDWNTYSSKYVWSVAQMVLRVSDMFKATYKEELSTVHTFTTNNFTALHCDMITIISINVSDHWRSSISFHLKQRKSKECIIRLNQQCQQNLIAIWDCTLQVPIEKTHFRPTYNFLTYTVI